MKYSIRDDISVTDGPIDLIQLDQVCRIGHNQLDSNHFDLVALFNDALNALTRSVSAATRRRVLISLERYMGRHFAHEEAIIRSTLSTESNADPQQAPKVAPPLLRVDRPGSP